MQRVHVMNMTKGKPLPLLAVFAFPLLIGNLFQQAYMLADSAIVGRLLGAGALAAVGSTGSISFLFFSLCNGISSGGGVVTAQYFGADKPEMVKRTIVNSAYVLLSISLVTGGLSFALVPTVLAWMGTPADILPDAITYMRITCASMPMVALYNYSSSIQRALGDSRTPLYFLIFSCFVNIGLDLFFVGPLHMGVFGAALATALSQLLAGAGSLLYAVRFNDYFRISRRLFAFSPRIARETLRLGLPMAMQWSLIAISTSSLQSFVNRFGTTAVAAYTATCRIDQLVQQPFGSLSMALASYCGQNYGAGLHSRIRLGFKDSMLAMTVISILMTLVMQFFGRSIVGMFVAEEEVRLLGGTALRITSLFYLFLGAIYVTRGVLNGVGDAFFSFLNGIVEMAGRIGLPYLLVLLPGVGVWSIWLTAGLTWMLSSLICVFRYLQWLRRLMHRTGSA